MELAAISAYVEQHIGTFHQKRLEKLDQLRLSRVLQRKNPYLFKAKNILTAGDFVRTILDAYLSSQEETLFGDFMEGLAIFVCQQTYGGYKPQQSEYIGIDLIFERDGIVYIVEIKSGPNWGNSSQINKMIQNFAEARSNLARQYPGKEIIAVNGCSYGRNAQHSQRDGTYWKLCGQDFWQLISGDETLYTSIVEPLGHRARYHDDQFKAAYARLINRFTLEFAQTYCDVSGAIDWEQLVRLVSQRNEKTSYPFA